VGRILAIDYGTKRCGLAVTDPTCTIAGSLDTVPTRDIFTYLTSYFRREQVEKIIVGEPRRLNNTASPTTLLAHQFAKEVMKRFPEIPCSLYDERFTSMIAERSLIQSGQSKKTRRNKDVLDRVSATILLQDYLSFSATEK